jgi:hypothetical protein
MEFNNCRGTAQASAKQGGLMVTLIATKDKEVTSSGTLAKVVVNGGQFKSAGASCIDSTSPQPVVVSNAHFEWISGTAYAIYSRVAAITANSCKFFGAFPSGSALRTTSTGTIELNGCELDINVADGSVVEYNAPANSVSGENNKLTSLATFRSQNAQNLKFRRGRNPATVASAATLVLSQNYDFTRVSGEAAISRIRFGAQDDYAKSFSDRITLVVDAGGAWSLSDAVNVKPKNTTARAPDEIVSLYFDPSVSVWYEI